MPARTVGISEARRLLPKLVREVFREGGRIDVTRRGQPVVCIVRSSDWDRGGAARDVTNLRENLRVEFNFPSDTLPAVIGELRSGLGHPRPLRTTQSRKKRMRRSTSEK